MSERQQALCGVIGPVVFATVFLVEGWWRDGYAPASSFVSALSLGPRGFIQIASFMTLGVLLLVFAQAVARTFTAGPASRAAPILMRVIAVGFLLSGPFVMDPAGTGVDDMTLHGVVHQLLGAVVFSLMPVSCFVLARRFRDDEAWRSMHAWTLTAGVVVVVSIVMLKLAQRPPTSSLAALTAFAGIFQRAALLTWLLWVVTFAAAIAARAQPSATATAGFGRA